MHPKDVETVAMLKSKWGLDEANATWPTEIHASLPGSAF